VGFGLSRPNVAEIPRPSIAEIEIGRATRSRHRHDARNDRNAGETFYNAATFQQQM
jgi:hypothetical protein